MLFRSKIATLFSSINESIRVIARFYRGEEVSKEHITASLKVVCEAAKEGAIRGAMVKTLQLVTKKNTAVVAVSVSIDSYSTILSYLNNEIKFEEMVAEIGISGISTAMVVILSLTYPPLGLSLLGASLMKTLWSEFNLGEKFNNKYTGWELEHFDNSKNYRNYQSRN